MSDNKKNKIKKYAENLLYGGICIYTILLVFSLYHIYTSHFSKCFFANKVTLELDYNTPSIASFFYSVPNYVLHMFIVLLIVLTFISFVLFFRKIPALLFVSIINIMVGNIHGVHIMNFQMKLIHLSCGVVSYSLMYFHTLSSYSTFLLLFMVLYKSKFYKDKGSVYCKTILLLSIFSVFYSVLNV
jgi:hypothetical protein